jgi:cell division protein ZapA
VNNLNEELNNMRKKISEADEKEINFQNEIIQLKKKVNENLIFYKNAEQKQSATEEINRSLSQQLEYLQSEKANIENTSNILNNKYNDINQEYTKLKNELLETKKKNQDLELNIKNLKNKLSSMESNQELLQLQSDLLNNLQKNIRQIYQIHFSNINLSNINKDENA